MPVEIRAETPEDRPSVRELLTAAFGRSEESELVDRLRRDGDLTIALVARDADRLVGHLALSRMTAPFRALGLGPIAVAPERQRAGIGSRLIRAALNRAEAEGWQGVVVLGEPAFYRRFGFDPALAAGFESPYAGPYLMARALGSPLPAFGRIAYAPAFADIG